MSAKDDWAPFAEVIKSAWLQALTAARNAALEEAAKALRHLDIHHHHVGYDDGPGGGNYVYAEVINLAEAEAAIRALIERESKEG